MHEGINIVLDYQPWWRGTALWIVDKRGSETHVAKPVELIFETHPEGEVAPEPTMRFSGYMAQQFLQSLADALSAIGYRPKIEQEWQSEITATKYHLEDMRALALKPSQRKGRVECSK